MGGNLKESGSGKSKKLAKRQAAHKMLQTLKSMPVERDNEQSFAMIDEDDLAQGKLLRFFEPKKLSKFCKIRYLKTFA